MKNYKLVGISESGSRVGETHHRAKLSDHDIDLIRELHEEGLSYREIAIKFCVGKSTVRDIVKCRRRWQTPVTWRKVEIAEEHKGVEVQELTPAKPKTLHGHCWRFPVEGSTAGVHTARLDLAGPRVSNETALRVLRILLRGYPAGTKARRDGWGMSVKQLASFSKLSGSAVSDALEILVFDGLVRYDLRVNTRQWHATEKARQLLDATLSVCLNQQTNKNED